MINKIWLILDGKLDNQVIERCLKKIKEDFMVEVEEECIHLTKVIEGEECPHKVMKI